MVCIYCGQKTKIINSRHQKRLNQKWRRHRCQSCNAVFTTIEAFEPSSTLLVAKGKKTAPFDRESFFISVHESVKHRPTSVQDAKALTDTIIALLTAQAERATLSRQKIISTTADTLKKFDKAAHTHYLAYHKV